MPTHQEARQICAVVEGADALHLMVAGILREQLGARA